MEIFKCVLGFLLHLSLSLYDPAAGCSIVNQTNYVEYVEGNSDVIISVSHGGVDLDPGIYEREPGCYRDGRCVWDYDCVGKSATKCKVVTINDMYTIETSRLIADEFERLTGKKAHLILNRLSRRLMDANRPRDEGTSLNPLAEAVWDDFQGYIEYAKCVVEDGLYLDIHGHGHPEGDVELGYRISKESLNDGPVLAYTSTVSWAARKTGLNLITGGYSFGHLLSQNGFSTVPSPKRPKPGSAKYFRGGYNVEKHGSLNGGSVDGIQVEIPKWVRWDEGNRGEFGTAMARAIRDFLRIRKGDTDRRPVTEEKDEETDVDNGDDDDDDDSWWKWWD